MIDKITEINKQGAEKTAKNLSSLLDTKVTVDIAHATLKKVVDIGESFDPEEIVAGVYLPVTGEIKGASLFILPREFAFLMTDLLLKQKPGTTRSIDELAMSALQETGNIISGCYLSTFSNILKIKLIEHIPQFSFDMFGAILEQIVSSFAAKADEALFIEIRYNVFHEKIKAYFLLLFYTEEIKLFLDKQ